MPVKDLATAEDHEKNSTTALDKAAAYNPKREQGEETTEGVEEALQAFLTRNSK